MIWLIDLAIDRSRAVLMSFVFIMIAGTVAYLSIPKEADPDIQLPTVYVAMTHDGISPADAERLLVRPMETELRGIEGVKEMTSTASQGEASVTLEFLAGVDIDLALIDVREAVDIAKADLPDETDEPSVNEINLGYFPVLVVTLAGDLPERRLTRIAEDLEDAIEGLPNVLSVAISGKREELVEVLIDPWKIEAYGLEAEEMLSLVARNNQLVAAGTLDTGQGRFAVRVPGLFETVDDILHMPVKVDHDTVVTLEDIASVRRSFKDAESFARVEGQPALALEVSKRIGTNIVDTVAQVREVVAAEQANWPPGIEVGFIQDKSDNIESMLLDLQNSVLSAVILVMIVVVAALGLRSAFLVGVAVPGSFLAGILVLWLMGLTVNIVVLFGLILAVGMLVDGAIVVTELADRKLAEGLEPREAYAVAARRMALPITASTMTTLAAFLPLVFWPGIVGEFMKYLPITLLATLTASLAMALIFIPNLGALIGRRSRGDSKTMRALSAESGSDLRKLPGGAGLYVRVLHGALRQPGKVMVTSMAIAVIVYMAYGTFGRGVEFFPEVEPERAQVFVHARGDLSVDERDRLVREVEAEILKVSGIDTVYANTAVSFRGEGIDKDAVGLIMLEFASWRHRPPARDIMAEITERTKDISGIFVEIRKDEAGPPVGKAVQVLLAGRSPEPLLDSVEIVRQHFDRMDGMINISDTRPVPGIEWRLEVDRQQAGRYGADVAAVGPLVQLVTNGVKLGSYRPDDADDELDIRARFPEDDRGIGRLDLLRVNTAGDPVPISNFVELVAAERVADIERLNGRRVYMVGADVAEGVLPDDKVRELTAWLASQTWPEGVDFSFKGEEEEQREAEQFLVRAFAVALFMIAMILVAQFNSFYQAGLILSAIVFSTVGVLLGLLITDQPFGVVMSGVGVIALAGIVVNNNIVLIDTYNDLRRRGLEPFDAVLLTGAQRLRPVLLTTLTTILGLMPMVLKLNVNLVGRAVEQGGPSMDWWSQLATAVAGGLAFATLLTLVLTPCLLYLPTHYKKWWQQRRGTQAVPSSQMG